MTNLRVGFAGGFALALCGAWLLGSQQAQAAQDYEFARGLLEMDSRRFPTEEFVERLANSLDAAADANVKLEGKLVRALLRRKQSETASSERRNELLMEADKLYQEFKAGGATHRLINECNEQADSIQLDFARALVKAAKDNPQRASEFHSKAVEILNKIANERKTEAEKMRPQVGEALKGIDQFFEKNPESEQAPKGLVDNASKALNNYIPQDKRYVVARAEQVDAYADSDPKKKEVAQELIKYCETQIGSDELSRLEDVTMWYHFMSGRVYSRIMMEDKAADSWKEALSISIEGLPPEGRRAVFDIKKLIYRDLVEMKMRAAAKDPKKYSEIIDIVGSAEYEPAMKTFFDEPAGKLLILDYAIALIRQPEAGAAEVETAIKKLRRVVEQGPPFSNNASRTMAEILNEVRNRKPPIRPRLSAQEWFDTARGFFIDGQLAHRLFKENEAGDPAKAKAAFDESYQKYEQAVEYYRRAIGQARNPAITDLPTRLVVEPQAWFEMGICYLKMENYYEAVIAYQSLRTTFGKKYRSRWLPDPNKDKAFYNNKGIILALLKLDRINNADPAEDGTLNATEKNIVIALNLMTKTKLSYNTRIKVDILDDGEIKLGDQSDTDYQAGKLAMDEAGDLKEQSEGDRKAGRKEQADKQSLTAFSKYKEAGARFEKIQQSSKAYEVGLYQAATCYYLAQIMASEKKVPLSPEETTAALKDLGEKALSVFKAYEERVAKEVDPTEEGQARRTKLARGVKLSRVIILFNMKDWENTLKAADEYAEYEQKNNVSKEDSKLANVVFYKFQALSHKGGALAPPECDAVLEAAEALIPQLAEHEKYYGYTLNNISARYSNAIARAKTAKLDQAILDKYNSKIAKYQATAVELKPEAERSLDDYGRLLYLYRETKKNRQAADIANKMLKTFDAQNQNCKVPDEQWAVIQARMDEINSATAFNSDFKLSETVRKEHKALLDFLFDTREGINNRENPARRPENDKFDVDFQKALEAIATIRKQYPTGPTVKPVAGNDKHFINGKSFLDFIGEEVEYRRRIIATRDLLSEIALEVAEGMNAAGDTDNAQTYRAMADEQLKVLEEVYGNVPAMKLKRAEINIANKNYDQALEILVGIKNGEPDRSSDLYVKSSKRISEVFKLKGNWAQAAEYPLFIAGTAGLESPFVKKNWPNMNEFLEECFKNGVERPKEIAASAKVDYRMKTPEEQEYDQLKGVWELGQTKKELLTPAFLWKYNFLKSKIDHLQEYETLERALLTHKGKPTEKEIVTPEFTARYDTVKALVGAESDLWKIHRKYQDLITEHGGPDKVPEAEKSKYEDARKKVKELTDKLGTTKPIKAESLEPAKAGAAKPEEAKTAETKTEAAKSVEAKTE